jgi:hypothetical protein
MHKLEVTISHTTIHYTASVLTVSALKPNKKALKGAFLFEKIRLDAFI